MYTVHIILGHKALDGDGGSMLPRPPTEDQIDKLLISVGWLVIAHHHAHVRSGLGPVIWSYSRSTCGLALTLTLTRTLTVIRVTDQLASWATKRSDQLRHFLIRSNNGLEPYVDGAIIQ